MGLFRSVVTLVAIGSVVMCSPTPPLPPIAVTPLPNLGLPGSEGRAMVHSSGVVHASENVHENGGAPAGTVTRPAGTVTRSVLARAGTCG